MSRQHRKIDLQDVKLPTDGPDGFYGHPEPTSDTCSVTMHVQNLEYRLAEFISEFDFVIGCFAWMTNGRVIDALSTRRDGCQIVVQKEDWLRPDAGGGGTADKLRPMYQTLRCGIRRHALPELASQLSYCSNPVIDPVRCMGIKGRGTFPRMHHKFIVGCSVHDGGDCAVIPEAVWTGSFNPTNNGELSLENAVILRSREIAKAYAYEWSCVLALSEPLDWTHEYIAPEWRIGS